MTVLVVRGRYDLCVLFEEGGQITHTVPKIGTILQRRLQDFGGGVIVHRWVGQT